MDFLPNFLIIQYAIRLPKPVLLIPYAMIKAIAISQEAELLKALRIPVVTLPVFGSTTSLIGAKPTNTVTISPIKVVPPMGKGFVIQPTIVATKTANISHAGADKPAGRKGVMHHRITPITKGKIKPL